jgi:hypothetical protein
MMNRIYKGNFYFIQELMLDTKIIVYCFGQMLRFILMINQLKELNDTTAHNKELHDLYSSPCIIRIIKSRRMRWAGHVARMGEKSNAYRLLVGKPEGKRPLGRPRRRWVDNIRMDLGEV